MCIGKCGWNYGNLISIVDKGKQMEKVDRRQSLWSNLKRTQDETENLEDESEEASVINVVGGEKGGE
ncbi:subtilisin-like serine protease protein [Lasius niger]|uniref:Subtilisin-like serine protease protein n=1 Tax=Lasius niger TaxID=67767 RepID=A0A0J7K6F8_LASNI|nr:subtilisin-like serine protease protein [Lasius niger]